MIVRKDGLSVWILAVILLAIVGGVGYGLFGRHTPKGNAQASLQEFKGTFNGQGSQYNYVVAKQGGQYKVTFTPVLPIDDAVVIEAIAALINQTYGKHTVTSPDPKLTEKDGKKYITWTAVHGKTYYFLLLKEKDGKVQGMSYFLQ
jgi:hypothetical protein